MSSSGASCPPCDEGILPEEIQSFGSNIMKGWRKMEVNTYHSWTSHMKGTLKKNGGKKLLKSALGENKPHCDTLQLYSEEQNGAQPHNYDYEKRTISRRTVKPRQGSYLRPWQDGGTNRLSSVGPTMEPAFRPAPLKGKGKKRSGNFFSRRRGME